MGSKYKKALEQAWDNKPISAMRVKTKQNQADKNISKILKRIRTRHDYTSLPKAKAITRRYK